MSPAASAHCAGQPGERCEAPHRTVSMSATVSCSHCASAAIRLVTKKTICVGSDDGFPSLLQSMHTFWKVAKHAAVHAVQPQSLPPHVLRQRQFPAAVQQPLAALPSMPRRALMCRAHWRRGTRQTGAQRPPAWADMRPAGRHGGVPPCLDGVAAVLPHDADGRAARHAPLKHQVRRNQHARPACRQWAPLWRRHAHRGPSGSARRPWRARPARTQAP